MTDLVLLHVSVIIIITFTISITTHTQYISELNNLSRKKWQIASTNTTTHYITPSLLYVI